MKFKMNIGRIFMIGTFIGLSWSYLVSHIEPWYIGMFIYIGAFMAISHVLQTRYSIIRRVLI